MNDPFPRTPGNSPNPAPIRPEFDPCEERLTLRDWSFLVYLLALSVIPLVAAVGFCLWIYASNPNFDSFRKGPAPFGPEIPVSSPNPPAAPPTMSTRG